MADKSIVSNSKLIAIADAIRDKTGKEDKLTLDSFATEIEGIKVGIEPEGTLDITENGEYNVTEYEKVNVEVQSGPAESGTMRAFLDTIKSMAYLFYQNQTITSIDGLLNYDDTTNVTNADSAFKTCTKLENIPILNFGNVTNAPHMFYQCSNITSIPNLNFGNVTNATYMFGSCSKLISCEIDIPNVTNSNNMFNSCTNLQSVTLKNCSKLTNVQAMFTSCSNLKTISGFNPNKLEYVQNLFSYASKLEYGPVLGTSKVTDMQYMFRNCSNLIYVPDYDMSNVKSTSYMFYYAKKLKTKKTFNMPKVTSINDMFSDNYWAEKIKIIADMAQNISATFARCYRLRVADINSLDNINSSYAGGTFYNCHNLKYLIIRNMAKVPPVRTDFYNISTYDAEKDKRIYVPDGMVSTLKGATNWSAWADNIYPLSELPENYDNESYILGWEGKTATTTIDDNTGTPVNNVLFKDGADNGKAILHFNIGNDYNKILLSGKLQNVVGRTSHIQIKIYAVDSDNSVVQEWNHSTLTETEYSFAINDLPQGDHTILVECILTRSSSGGGTVCNLSATLIKE